MANIELVNSGAKLTEKIIKGVEKKHGIVFPPHYRKFMLKYNGGYIKGEHAVLCDDGDDIDWSVISTFMCATKHKTNTYMLDWQMANCDRRPAGSFPVADTDGGDRLYLFFEGGRAGQVWIENHEMGEDDDPESGLLFVARSFPKFLDGLVEDENLPTGKEEKKLIAEWKKERKLAKQEAKAAG